MSDEIEFNEQSQSWSFVASETDGPGWHNRGRVVSDDVSTEEWRRLAGHLFTISKRTIRYETPAGLQVMADRFVHARNDNDHALGIGSDRFVLVQPQEVDDICDEFAEIAGNLKRSAAFTLRKGEMICSTYAYRDPLSVGGDRHTVHLMGATANDGSSSTNFWASVIRAVCRNTIEAGLGSTKARVSVRHNTKIDPEKVREDLAAIAQSIKQYKDLGDALARFSMSREQVSAFFKAALGIPQDATTDAKGKVIGTTTRKFNQFVEVTKAWNVSKRERNGDESMFTAAQGLLRFVDHGQRGVKTGGVDETIARFDSANFGSGALIKNRGMGLLLPMLQEKVAA